MRAIVWRTYLINDDEAMAAVNRALAEQVTRWGALSITKTEQAIDALVDEFDPGALRRSRDAMQQRTVEFGSPSDAPGTGRPVCRHAGHPVGPVSGAAGVRDGRRGAARAAAGRHPATRDAAHNPPPRPGATPTALCAVADTGRVRALPRPDVSLPGLRPTRNPLRH